MTIIDLVDSLADFLAKTVCNYQLPTSQIGAQTMRAPQIVKYYLPVKDSRNKEMPADFPCIIIRPINGVDDEHQSTLKLRLIIGTYAEDHHGIMDAINILERIKLELYQTPILANRYALEKPCNYEIPEEQPIPEWYVSLELKFNL